MKLANHISVSIAENDDLGQKSNKATNIEFHLGNEPFLHFETRDMEGTPIDTNDRVIMIHGNRVKHNGTVHWAGNRKWNMYFLPYDYALGLIALLSKNIPSVWTIVEAWDNIMDKIGNGEEITGFDLELEEDVKPMVVIPNQLGIPFQKRNRVDVKVYEPAELYEIPIKPLVEWVRKKNLGGDFGGPEVIVTTWNPGYYSFNLFDDDLDLLYKYQQDNQSVLKILGTEPLED